MEGKEEEEEEEGGMAFLSSLSCDSTDSEPPGELASLTHPAGSDLVALVEPPRPT